MTSRNLDVTDPHDAHRQWRKLLNAALQEELATLDPATRNRLQQARNRALSRRAPPTPIRAPIRARPSCWGFPLGAALAGVLAFAILPVTVRDIPNPTPVSGLSDVEWTLELAIEEAEFAISEDLEFYAWLAAREAS